MTVSSFRIAVPDQKLARIRARLEDAHIGYAPDDDLDWQYGTDAGYLSEFRDYWLNSYDWRRAEAWLNIYAQYKTSIDGTLVHFYHVPGDGPEPFPLILTHGWPGSVVEFLDVIPLLTSRGYTVVVPSLPGYGFSGRPRAPIGPRRVAAMWRTLMVDGDSQSHVPPWCQAWRSPPPHPLSPPDGAVPPEMPGCACRG